VLNIIGLKGTFIDTTYLYGIIGAFWGASYAVEQNCGNWWKAHKGNKIIKFIIIFISVFVYLFIFSKYN
jgi:hypothetical protein